MKKAVAHLKQADPVMARIITSVGPYKGSYLPPTFRSLVRSITFQQLHGKAARTIFDRLELACGGEITPESILKLSEKQMRAVGLSRQKLTYIRDLAQKTHDRQIVFEELRKLKDDVIIARLTAVKGI